MRMAWRLDRIGRAGIAALVASAGFILIDPATAVQDDDGQQQPKKQERLLDRLVPIPGWSKDVANNGCRLYTAPSAFSTDALTSLTEIPLWELIEHHVGPYSVRASLDPPDKFAQGLEGLDPDVRTLALLHVLWNGLGRDGLHTYLYMQAGQTAPVVRDALEAAGLTREHRLFTEAMALFGQTYPLDNDVREKAFGYATESQDLNEFDHRLLALSRDFGSRQQWTAKIVGYVNRNPALWQRIEAARATLSDARRFEYLSTALLADLGLWKPYAEVDQVLARLTGPQRTLAILAAFNFEFENGGVHQFFYNAEGAIAPDVRQALVALGLDRQAELIGKGIAMFGDAYPRDTGQRREAHFHDHEGWNDWDKELSELTDAFYALDGGPQVLHMGGDVQIDGGPGLRYAMLAFAKQHNLLPC
jgi:hypothetical protein